MNLFKCSRKLLFAAMAVLSLTVLLSMTALAAPALSQTKANLGPGETLQLGVSGYEGVVKWKSSKPSVAKVSKTGLVKAKKKGSSRITAKCGRLKLSCKVTVSAANISSISLNAGAVEIQKGRTYKLKASVVPGGASVKYVWKSSKPSVASVSRKGKIKAKKSGEATITVKVKGSSLEAECTVTVKDSVNGGSKKTKGFTKNSKNSRVNKNPTSYVPFVAFAPHQASGQHELVYEDMFNREIKRVSIAKFDDFEGYTLRILNDGYAQYMWKGTGDYGRQLSTVDISCRVYRPGDPVLPLEKYDLSGIIHDPLNPAPGETANVTPLTSFIYNGHTVYMSTVSYEIGLSWGKANYESSIYFGGQAAANIGIPFTIGTADNTGAVHKGIILIHIARNNGTNCAEFHYSQTDINSILDHFIFPQSMDFKV